MPDLELSPRPLNGIIGAPRGALADDEDRAGRPEARERGARLTAHDCCVVTGAGDAAVEALAAAAAAARRLAAAAALRFAAAAALRFAAAVAASRFADAAPLAVPWLSELDTLVDTPCAVASAGSLPAA